MRAGPRRPSSFPLDGRCDITEGVTKLKSLTRRGTIVWIILLLAALGVVGACSSTPTATPTPTVPPTATPFPLGELRVDPSVLLWPDGQAGDNGIWVYASGLQPGQWFELSFDVRGKTATPTLAGLALSQADETGSFAGALVVDGREGRDFLSTGMTATSGPITVELSDLDTGQIIATFDWVLCGLDRDAAYCEGAGELLPLPESE